MHRKITIDRNSNILPGNGSIRATPLDKILAEHLPPGTVIEYRSVTDREIQIASNNLDIHKSKKGFKKFEPKIDWEASLGISDAEADAIWKSLQ